MRHFLECIDFRRDEPTWDKAYGICANGRDSDQLRHGCRSGAHRAGEGSAAAAGPYSAPRCTRGFLPRPDVDRHLLATCANLTVKVGRRESPRPGTSRGWWTSRAKSSTRACPTATGRIPKTPSPCRTAWRSSTRAFELQSDIIFENETTDVEKAVLGRAAAKMDTLGGMVSSGLGRVQTDAKLDDVPYVKWLIDEGNRKRAAEMLRELCK